MDRATLLNLTEKAKQWQWGTRDGLYHGLIMPPEPIGQWMHQQGFPPWQCSLWLSPCHAILLDSWPVYVHFSELMTPEVMVLMRNPYRPRLGTMIRKGE